MLSKYTRKLQDFLLTTFFFLSVELEELMQPFMNFSIIHRTRNKTAFNPVWKLVGQLM